MTPLWPQGTEGAGATVSPFYLPSHERAAEAVAVVQYGEGDEKKSRWTNIGVALRTEMAARTSDSRRGVRIHGDLRRPPPAQGLPPRTRGRRCCLDPIGNPRREPEGRRDAPGSFGEARRSHGRAAYRWSRPPRAPLASGEPRAGERGFVSGSRCAVVRGQAGPTRSPV